MALRPILIHPDPRLRKAAERVSAFDGALAALIDDMFETMYDAPGIGLAAPQIGVSRRIFVMDCGGRTDDATDEDPDPLPPEPLVMINPEIVRASDELRAGPEGCLSIPEEYDDVARPAVIDVRFQDGAGAPQERTFDGIRAACFQHELDHLDGKLFIDHLGPVKRSLITARMKKLKRERAREKAK